MAAPQNFRSAFNGFNKEDVVHYLEYINSKHNTELNQLTAENEELRAQLSRQPEDGLLEELQQRCALLEQQLTEAQAKCADLESQLGQQEEVVVVEKPQAVVASPSISEELEAYRRAERIEREARERAELVYFQANGVLSEATAKVDSVSADITEMADQVMTQLTQLQVSVSKSKQALQDASSIMSTIRPNK